MNYIITTCILVILFFIWYNYKSKKRYQKLFTASLSNWLITKPNKEFDFSKITRYYTNKPKDNTVYQDISPQTNLDLDLDDVFEYIDRTTSKIGQQYLYYKLHTIESKIPDKETHQLVDLFEHNPTLRTHTILALSALNTKESYYFESLFTTPPTQKMNQTKLVWILNGFTIGFLILMLVYPMVGLLIVPILFYNAILHYKTKNEIQEYQSGVEELHKVYTVSTTFFNQTKSSPIFSNTADIYKLKELKTIAQYLSFGKKLDNEFATILWLFVEWIKILFNVEYLAFGKLLKKIKLYNSNLHQAFVVIGKIDLALAILHIKHTESVVVPEFCTTKTIDTVNLVHPLVSNCVTNDLHLHHQSLLITGSNMSGKTTFIRALAINALLAQTIGLVFADKYVAPFVKIHSFIRISDDLTTNRSYYLQEVLALKAIVDAAATEDANLFVLDELMKGTNTIERIAGSTAIVKHLNTSKDIVLVSTHDLELIDLLQEHQFAIAHFNESIEDNNLIFDYKLKQGKPNTTNTIKILELYAFPNTILAEANSIKKDSNKPF